MSLWFRWYEGTTEDGKFRVTARNAGVTVRDVIALWAFILEDASSDEHRGICTRNEDFMASVLDFDDGVAERILEAMEDQNMISVGHGNITIINWGKRQFETDKTDGTNAERQRRFRERYKETGAKRDRNGSVTAEKRPETEADTETDKKKELRTVAKATRPADSAFEEFWKAYPRRKGANPKHPAQKLFDAAVRAGTDPNLIIGGAHRCAQLERDKIGTEYIPQAVKWLRDRRWLDYQLSSEVPLPEIPGFYASFDSMELVMWDRYEREIGKSTPRDKNGGWRFPTQWPPGHEPKTEAA
jgi:hypothetical protein